MSRPIAAKGRRRLGVAATVLAAGALAAGCGTTHAGSGGTGGGSAGTATGGAPATPAPTASASAPATGGTLPSGVSSCTGWPAGAASGTLPASFVPVKVERCVNGATAVPGKGLWVTATLTQADSGLTGLVSALRQAPAKHTPGTMCPALATVPPQIALVSASGQVYVPQLPRTGCGEISSQVLAALGTLHWKTVSVRLISPISGTSPSGPAASGTPAPRTAGVAITGMPRAERTGGAVAAG